MFEALKTFSTWETGFYPEKRSLRSSKEVYFLILSSGVMVAHIMELFWTHGIFFSFGENYAVQTHTDLKPCITKTHTVNTDTMYHTVHQSPLELEKGNTNSCKCGLSCQEWNDRRGLNFMLPRTHCSDVLLCARTYRERVFERQIKWVFFVLQTAYFSLVEDFVTFFRGCQRKPLSLFWGQLNNFVEIYVKVTLCSRFLKS